MIPTHETYGRQMAVEKMATYSFWIGLRKERPIDLPPDGSEIENYFDAFTLKFAGGSNNDRGGSLNCKLVSW